MSDLSQTFDIEAAIQAENRKYLENRITYGVETLRNGCWVVTERFKTQAEAERHASIKRMHGGARVVMIQTTGD